MALSVEDLNRDFQVNTASVLEAAKHAVAGFDRLPKTAARTFIYTGNRLTDGPLPRFVDLGIGKNGSAHLIAAASEAYAPKGYQYVVAELVTPKGQKGPQTKLTANIQTKMLVDSITQINEAPKEEVRNLMGQLMVHSTLSLQRTNQIFRGLQHSLLE